MARDTFSFEPDLAKATTLPAAWYTEPGTAETWNGLQDSIAFSDEIQQEDIRICEDVWRNLQTGVYDRGRFSVKRENGVHHFQGLVAEFLQQSGKEPSP